MEDLIGIALRASIMYLYVLALLRLSGKRTIGALSPADLVVTFVIGDLVDDVFWAEVPLAKGLVGLTTIVLLHILVEYGTYKSKTIDHLFGSQKVVVVREGQFVEEGLRHERLSKGVMWSQLRMQGEDKLEELREVNREPSGETSVLKREEAKPVQKRDLPELLEAFR